MYFQALLEHFFPSIASSNSVKMKKLNISNKNKQTNFWKEMCTGYNRENIVPFLLWLVLFVSCVWTIIQKAFFSNETDKIFDLVSFSIAAVIILIIMIVVASGMKKNPTPIFEYMNISKTKFSEIAKHYDNAKKISYGIRVDSKFIYLLSNGKTYCIPMKEYSNIKILTHNHHFKWWFGMALIRADYCSPKRAVSQALILVRLQSGTSRIFLPRLFCLLSNVLFYCIFCNITNCTNIISSCPKRFIPLTL